MNKGKYMLAALLALFIFIAGCAHFRKDCPEPKRLPDEWLECSDHRSGSERHSPLSAGETATAFIFEVSGA